jgi:zinc protease
LRIGRLLAKALSPDSGERTMNARCFFVFLALALTGCAQRLVPPLDYSAPSVHPPDEPFRAQGPPVVPVADAKDVVHDSTLPNGLRVVVVERPGFPSVSVHLLIDRGPVDVGDVGGLETSQMAYFYGRGGDQGTFDSLQLDSARIGATWSLGSDDDSVHARVRAPSNALGPALSILARVSFGAKLTTAEYGRAVAQLRDGQRVRPLVLAERYVLFGADHPYGNKLKVPSPRPIEDVIALHDRLFRPGQAVLVLVGDVRAADAETEVARAFGSWQATPPIPKNSSEPAAFGGPRLGIVSERGLTQRFGAVFARGPAAASEDAAAFGVVAGILGGAISSGLSQELREEAGATYQLLAPVRSHRLASAVSLTASYDAEKAVGAVRKVLAGVDAVRKGRETDAQIAVARAKAIADLRSELATLEGTASLYERWIAAGQDVSRLSDYPARIERVGRDDLTRVARMYLAPEALHVAFLGEDRWLEAESLGLGKPTKIDIGW